MDIIKFYEDYKIPFQVEGHKHCRPGWVNIECPFCTGNPGVHLGFSLTENYFHCWRCGGKDTIKTLQKLIGCSRGEASRIFREYGGKRKPKLPTAVKAQLRPVKKKVFRFPTGTMSLQKFHRIYLKKRGFDPKELEQEWNLLGTGPVAYLKEGDFKRDYRMRIIIPIHWSGEVVSFQARDVTGRSELKYKACPKDREKIHHKSILYGMDKVEGNKVVVVEGVTDVWRLGPGSVATFGTAWKEQQLSRLCRFKEVYLMFDNDKAGTKAAEKMRKELLAEGIKSEIISVDVGDPGDLDQVKARKLMKDLL